jgi:hypothetical protein
VKAGNRCVVNAIIIGWIAPQSVEARFEFELPWMRQACQYEFIHKWRAWLTANLLPGGLVVEPIIPAEAPQFRG